MKRKSWALPRHGVADEGQRMCGALLYRDKEGHEIASVDRDLKCAMTGNSF
jgi:hypothetical protein